MSQGNKSPRDIICFGNDWYSPSKVSIRQIIDHYHEQGSRILWINPVPIRFPNTRKKDFWSKVQNKARTHSRFLNKIGEGQFVYSPLYLPVFNGPGFVLNRLAVSAQILLVRLILGIRAPLVFGSTFTAWFGLWGIGRAPLVFHFADKISSFREVSTQPQRRKRLEDMEQVLVDRAVLTTCSSRSIYTHVLDLAGGDTQKVRYFPHAIKAALFIDQNGTARKIAGPDDLADIKGPIAGYFGSLTEANDKATFVAAATALPDWTFVFIGKTSGDYSALDKQPNVRLLGPREHHLIPAYGSRFDVCFMGWRPHEWISNCFPLKTLEYLALGKPIVCSSHIDELDERFPGLVVMTGSPAEFAAAIVDAAGSDSAELKTKRIEAVKSETWDHRLDEIDKALHDGKARYA